MHDAERPTFHQVFYMPYDQLKALPQEELEQLLQAVEKEARRAVLAYNWLEGLIRHKCETGNAA